MEVQERETGGIRSGGFWLDPEILGVLGSPKLMCSNFTNVTFLCKLCRIHDHACILPPEVDVVLMALRMRVDCMTRSDGVILLTYAVISFLRSLPGIGARLISASGFEHPASTLPTRFPEALGIGHGSACGLANACALVYVAA